MDVLFKSGESLESKDKNKTDRRPLAIFPVTLCNTQNIAGRFIYLNNLNISTFF